MADEYWCYVDEHENLTAAVDAMLEKQQVVSTNRLARISMETPTGQHTLEMSASGWKVLVKCSKGHENVFTGD